MSCMLIKELQEIDEKLKSLKAGQVIEFSDLDKKQGTSICRYYGNKYNVLGPFADDIHSGKYIVAFSLKPKRAQNA